MLSQIIKAEAQLLESGEQQGELCILSSQTNKRPEATQKTSAISNGRKVFSENSAVEQIVCFGVYCSTVLSVVMFNLFRVSCMVCWPGER